MENTQSGIHGLFHPEMGCAKASVRCPRGASGAQKMPRCATRGTPGAQKIPRGATWGTPLIAVTNKKNKCCGYLCLAPMLKLYMF